MKKPPNKSPKVIIIVDPKFRNPLMPLMLIAPIWIVATEFNKNVYMKIWQENKLRDPSDKGAITAFNIVNSEQLLSNLLNIIPDVVLNIIPDVELHHAIEAGDIIEIIGVTVGKDVIEGLQKDRFSLFSETTNAFRAYKM